MPNNKLQFIIDNLKEDIEVEVKNWLGGLADNGSKASLAKEIIALANSGGGSIFIGFDDQGANLTEIAPAEGEFEAYTQDTIAGLVHRYVSPPCQCRLEFLTPAGSNQSHPVIVVPGEHRTPVFAARGGPNGEVVSGKVYVRRPGGFSEAARTQDDWEKLLERLVKARQSEMLTAIREVIAPSSKIIADEESTLQDWYDENYGQWQQIVGAFDADDPRRLEHGHWIATFSITEFHTESLRELNEFLDREIPKYSGWPPFTYLHRPPVQPMAAGDSITAYIGELRDDEQPADRTQYSDFWRVSRDGKGFLLRPMEEDRLGFMQHIQPRPAPPYFEWTIPVCHMAEMLKYIEAIADRFGSDNSRFELLVAYIHTRGRTLQQSDWRYALDDGARCNVDQLKSQIEAPVTQINTNIEELIRSILQPIYEQFEFSELPRALISNVVRETLANRRR